MLTTSEFAQTAIDTMELVGQYDDQQVSLNGLDEILKIMGQGVLEAYDEAEANGDAVAVLLMTGQTQVLNVLLQITRGLLAGLDAEDLAPDLADELEQVLSDAV